MLTLMDYPMRTQNLEGCVDAENTLVSIGLPVRNGEAFLEEALRSALEQSYHNLEIIVSDNASKDRTREIVQDTMLGDSRIRYLRQAENVGAIPNYNNTLNAARGQYFKWLAHDDKCDSLFVSNGVAFLEAHPDVVLVYGRIHYLYEDGHLEDRQSKQLEIRGETHIRRVHEFLRVAQSSDDLYWQIFGLVRTDKLKAIGGLGRFVASDQIALLDLCRYGEMRELDQSRYVRRVHADASTVKERSMLERLLWYDSEAKPRVVLPKVELAGRYISSVRSVEGAGPSTYTAIAYRFAREWREFLKQFASVPGQIMHLLSTK
jgi:glycosyltransferase involved in cell wall biosynthesis